MTVDADARAAGVLFVANGRVLLLKRAASAADHPDTWCTPGGHVDPGESAAQAARREVEEETGYQVGKRPLRKLWRTPGGFVAFGVSLEQPFHVKLNDEHTAARWAPFDDLPQPLHPGLARSLREMTRVAANDGAVRLPVRDAVRRIVEFAAQLAR